MCEQLQLKGFLLLFLRSGDRLMEKVTGGESRPFIYFKCFIL